MDEIENTLSRLRHQLAMWREEYEAFGLGAPKGRRTSSMGKRDLRWLEARIRKVEKVRDMALRVARETEAEVDKGPLWW